MDAPGLRPTFRRGAIAATLVASTLLSVGVMIDLIRPFRLQPLTRWHVRGISVALAVAAAAASFTVVKQAFFDSLPYTDGDRIVTINTVRDDGTTGALSNFALSCRISRILNSSC